MDRMGLDEVNVQGTSRSYRMGLDEVNMQDKMALAHRRWGYKAMQKIDESQASGIQILDSKSASSEQITLRLIAWPWQCPWLVALTLMLPTRVPTSYTPIHPPTPPHSRSLSRPTTVSPLPSYQPENFHSHLTCVYGGPMQCNAMQ